jgi:hypothetical protein
MTKKNKNRQWPKRRRTDNDQKEEGQTMAKKKKKDSALQIYMGFGSKSRLQSLLIQC